MWKPLVSVRWVVLAVLFAFGQGCSSPGSADRTVGSATNPGATALYSMTGRWSDVAAARYELARSQEQFDHLWRTHMGERVETAAQGWAMPPDVDFERCAVLFVFGGELMNSNGYTLEEIARAGRELVIRIDQITYQTSSVGACDQGDRARPWGMFVLDRPIGPVRLEENVQGIIGRPPKWKIRAMWDAAGDFASNEVITSSSSRAAIDRPSSPTVNPTPYRQSVSTTP